MVPQIICQDLHKPNPDMLYLEPQYADSADRNVGHGSLLGQVSSASRCLHLSEPSLAHNRTSTTPGHYWTVLDSQLKLESGW